MKVFNPILSGFHADPSICCANGEYYIANSTFEWFPGVELHRSKDLKTWEQVPSPLSTTTLLDMEGNKASCGIWAPCLTYCEEEKLFYLVYTNVRSWCDGPFKDCPNYITTAPSIEGPWSDPWFVNASGFDASLFHENGKHWFVNMEWDYRFTGPRQFSGILLQEFDTKLGKLVGECRKIFLGTDIGLVEGPHIFKKDSYYYLACAEGGTCYEHAETVARSENLFGPYEVHPNNPLISAYGRDDAPVKRTGHGAWCHSPDGKKTWFVYLCGRPLPGTERCPLGRETGIAELEWKDGWPWVKQPDGSVDNIPPAYIELPGDEPDVLPGQGAMHAAEKYTFTDHAFLSDFKLLRVPFDEKRYSITERPGYLRIHGGMSPVSSFGQSLLARRQTEFTFTAETKLEYNPTSFQHMAGMTYRYDEKKQYLCVLTHHETLGKVLQVLTIMPDGFVREMEIPMVHQDASPVWLKLEVTGPKGWFFWSEDGKTWRKLRPLLDTSRISDEYDHQGFTGAFVGMYCADMIQYQHYADFEYFTYKGTV